SSGTSRRRAAAACSPSRSRSPPPSSPSRSPERPGTRPRSSPAVRVLLVDNYDSFAFNLVQALAALGAQVVVRRNDAVSVAQALELAGDAVVVSPGPCTPAQAGVSVDLVRAAAERGLPLLGVC